MNITGTTLLSAPVDSAWMTLTSPQQLSLCTPGLVSWETIEPRQKFRLVMAYKNDNGRAALTIPVILHWQINEPAYTLTIDSTIHFGRSTIPAGGSLQLRPLAAGQTELQFTAVIHTPNPLLTQITKTTAPKFIDNFCKNLQKITQPAP